MVDQRGVEPLSRTLFSLLHTAINHSIYLFVSVVNCCNSKISQTTHNNNKYTIPEIDLFEIIYTLVVMHLTATCITLFLHRGQAHRAVEFHPALSQLMRFWLWLTSGVITKQWVAIHRQHHRFTDKTGDPHSPKISGLWNILYSGFVFYFNFGNKVKIIPALCKGTPDDWIENKVYIPYPWAGVLLWLIINLAVFGYIGLVIWTVHVLWAPFLNIGVVNGLSHIWGYRNYDTNDTSRNILPVGILVCGEELHNNHHAASASAKFSKKWWEFDIGWMYIKIFEKLKLAKVRYQ